MFFHNEVGEDMVVIFMKEPFRNVPPTKTLQSLLCQNRQLDARNSPWLVFSNLKKLL